MKALWLEKGQLIYREDLPIPVPESDEALVEIYGAGICGTDLEMVDGYASFCGIPGHEFIGRIREAPGCPERIGERVVADINITCGKCRWCLKGMRHHCDRRKVAGIRDCNGAFAEFICLPLENLITVPDNVSDDEAVFAEPVAAALRITEQIAIRPEDRVLVVGAGRMGQIIARIVSQMACHLTVIARYETQRRRLEAEDIAWIAEDAVPQRQFDHVIEATGCPSGFSQAISAVRPMGTIILKSTYREKPAMDLTSMVVNEISVIGSRCGSMTSALDFLKKDGLRTLPLIEKRYPLVNGMSAFEIARKPGMLKVLLDVKDGKNTS